MSSIKDSDSIYSRDLLVAPVRTLSALLKTGYSTLTIHGPIFMHMVSQAVRPGTPNPVFQPKTLVFTGSRPMEEMRAQGQIFRHPDEFVESILQSEQFDEVKEEGCPGRCVGRSGVRVGE